MGKKQYTRPEVQAYQVNPSEVICGSGGDSASISMGGGSGPTPNSSGNFTGNSASSRSGWEEYEGRW